MTIIEAMIGFTAWREVGWLLITWGICLWVFAVCMVVSGEVPWEW